MANRLETKMDRLRWLDAQLPHMHGSEARLQKAIKKFAKGNERNFIDAKFFVAYCGISDGQTRSYDTVAAENHVTRETARQRVLRAIRRLKRDDLWAA